MAAVAWMPRRRTVGASEASPRPSCDKKAFVVISDADLEVVRPWARGRSAVSLRSQHFPCLVLQGDASLLDCRHATVPLQTALIDCLNATVSL
uniref:Uncharacterized protein n=1 Tax=Steinernema glaseri TaxID=37863 RepID=A0A1I8AHN8_9BILA